MKSLITIAALLLGTGAAAQQVVSLQLGSMNVRLGMTKAQFAAIAPDDYQFTPINRDIKVYGKADDKHPVEQMPDENSTVCKEITLQPPDFDCYGEVSFKGGRLVYATRGWVMRPETSDNMLASVVNALRAVTESATIAGFFR
jgi:hypothetical protein